MAKVVYLVVKQYISSLFTFLDFLVNSLNLVSQVMGCLVLACVMMLWDATAVVPFGLCNFTQAIWVIGKVFYSNYDQNFIHPPTPSFILSVSDLKYASSFEIIYLN